MCVEREAIGTKADNGPVFLVAAPELQVSVAFPGVVGGVEVCEFGEEGARVFGEGVEVEAVNRCGGEIGREC